MEQVKERVIIRKKFPTIRPYIDGKSENMGLAKYGEVVVPGTYWDEALTCLESNGVKRYLTGLDEFAPEVRSIVDPEKKKAVIKNIREKVAFLEKALASNVIDSSDESFWSKVTIVRPNNHEFWKEITLRLGNDPVFLDPEDPNQLILLSAVEAGGFQAVAKSFDDARFAAVAPKWYLDKETDTAISNNELRKIKNKAKSLLEKLFEKDSRKMFYLVKNIDSKPHQYVLSTSNEVLYATLDDYIEGRGADNAKKASTRFVQYASMPLAELKIRAAIADGSFYQLIIRKPDGKLYHKKTDKMLGDNVEELVEYFKNSLNAQTWEDFLEEVESRWKL